MRSLRALRLLRFGNQSLRAPCKFPRSVIQNVHCSSCATLPPCLEKYSSIPPADHRQLAIEQELFTTSTYSPGSPLFLPNGTIIFGKLISFLRAQYEHFGFQEVISPTIYKKALWEKSGHWENYAEDMFSVTGGCTSATNDTSKTEEDEQFGLKPMNCPGHCLLFASKQRSFRELPVRYADFSPLHRNELSGALSGLTRVRRFHQDDGHIFCRPSQVGEEISQTLDFVRLTYQTFGLGPYRLALSTRPKEHYIGTAEEWDNAESALRHALDASGQEWIINEGDGAFYGPKIDIILKDSDGKEHQTATIQLDFQLPKRFELEYIAPAPDLEQKGLETTDPELLAASGPVRPVMIHRAVLGSVERFMALLIEHYNGKWPFWLNPRQVMIIAVNDTKEVVEYARWAKDEIQGGRSNQWFRRLDLGSSTQTSESKPSYNPRELYRTTFSIDIDDSARTVNKKLLEAKQKGYSIIILVGKKNVEGGEFVTVDFRGIQTSQAVIAEELLTLKHIADAKKKAKEIGSTQILGKSSSSDEILDVDKVPSTKLLTGKDISQVDVQPRKLRQLLLQLHNAYQ